MRLHKICFLRNTRMCRTNSTQRQIKQENAGWIVKKWLCFLLSCGLKDGDHCLEKLNVGTSVARL